MASSNNNFKRNSKGEEIASIIRMLGCVELLMRPGKRQNQLGDPGTQSPQLMSPLGFSSVRSCKSVTFYSLAHNCRFPKDLGCALQWQLMGCIPHVSVIPSSGAL